MEKEIKNLDPSARDALLDAVENDREFKALGFKKKERTRQIIKGEAPKNWLLCKGTRAIITNNF